MFLTRSNIELLYCFENRWPAVFSSVHRMFKFIIFVAQKGKKTSQFRCAFMKHDPENLSLIDKNALQMNFSHVKKFSPYSLSFIEFNNYKDIKLTEKIYSDYPILGKRIDDTWNIELSQEFNRSSDSHLFNTTGDGCQLIEGKNINIFDAFYFKNLYYIKKSIVEENEYKSRWKQFYKKKVYPKHFDHEQYRTVFRRIAASTNERTFISTIIPMNSVCPDTNLVVRRLFENKISGLQDEFINLNESIYLSSTLNSFVIDYIVRQKVTTHLDMHFVYTIPVKRISLSTEKSQFFISINARAKRLVSIEKCYSFLWSEAYNSNYQNGTFWYPPCAPIDTYGPAHEQEIRKRLRDEASGLTTEWGPHCGVHDRLVDRRDTGDRAQLRAEIDAYVAHLYGLSRDDFAYILDTFPVLKKKEMKAFGEFMSKRKCLEEYDRIGLVLREG